MEWLTLIFNEPRTPWAITGVLFFLSCVFGWRWAWHGKRLRDRIRRIRTLSGLSTTLSIKDEAERWHLFATEHFETAKADLSPIAVQDPLARQTLNFLRRCQLFQDQGFDQRRLETAACPSETLRLTDYLLERNIHVSLFKAFPNYLVGVGLCITFLGLAVVIGNASLVLSPGNEGDSSLALRDLLVAASSKFWSSLAAVAFSIFYGVRFRSRSQRMEREIALLARDVEHCVRVLSTEEMQYESLIRLRKCEEYHSVTAMGIGMLKAGIDNSQSIGTEQHQSLVGTLQFVASKLERAIGGTGLEIGKGIANGVGAELTQEIQRSLESLRDVANEFDRLSSQVKNQSTGISTSIGSAEDSAKQIATSFQELPALTEPLKQVSLLLHHGAEVVTSSIGKIVQENVNLAERWEELGDLVRQIDNELGKAVGSAAEVFPKYAEKLSEFSEGLQSAMVKALGGLAANIKDLEGSHEELRGQRSVWQESAEAVARSVDEINHQISLLAAVLAAHNRASESAPPVITEEETLAAVPTSPTTSIQA
jgi:methyl-accepting chemotaxis protein